MQTDRSTDEPDPVRLLNTEQRQRLDDLLDDYELAIDDGRNLSPEVHCGEHPELLAAFRYATKRLSRLDARMRNEQQSPADPREIGEFEVIERIGSGGAGVVFRCRQMNPPRYVAVKVLKPTLTLKEQESCFEREMAAVAELQDVGIPAVHGSGTIRWAGIDSFWFAMELAEGGHIDEYVKNQSMSDRQILLLFKQVCETVFAAHQRGILHRDLKPSNILVTHNGDARIADFGIARFPQAVSYQFPTETLNRPVGTAAWLAPELLLGESSQAEVRTDIYGLGVVLFELLSGQHPVLNETSSLVALLDRLRQDRMPLLSSVRADVSRDLETFVSRLIHVDAQARYQTLAEVLTDLDLLLAGEPIRARPISLLERCWRWCCRNKELAVTSATASLVVVASIAAFLSSHIETQRYAKALSARTEELQSALELQRRSSASSRLRALQETVAIAPEVVRNQLEDSEIFPSEMRGLAWNLLYHLSERPTRELEPLAGEVRRIRLDRTGTRVIATSKPRALSVTSLRDGERIFAEEDIRIASPLYLARDVDAVFCQARNGDVLKLSLTDGTVVDRASFGTATRHCYAVSPDSTQVLCFSHDNRLLLYDTESKQASESPETLKSSPVAAWFDGQGVKVLLPVGIIESWELSSLRRASSIDLRTVEPQLNPISFAAYSPDMFGGSAVALAQNGLMNLIGLEPRPGWIFQCGLYDTIREVSLMPPHHAAITDSDSVHIYHRLRPDEPRVVSEPGLRICASALTDRSETVVTGAVDGRVKLFSVYGPSIQKAVLTPFFGDAAEGREIGAPTCSVPLGGVEQLLIGHNEGWVATVDTASGKAIEAFRHVQAPIRCMTLIERLDAIAVAYAGPLPQVVVWPLNALGSARNSGETFRHPPSPLSVINLDAAPRAMQVCDSANLICVALRSGQIAVIDTTDARITKRWDGASSEPFSLAVRNGRAIIGDASGWIRVWDIDKGSLIREWHAHEKRVTAIKVSPISQQLMSASGDGEIRIWTDEGLLQKKLIGHRGRVISLAVSADGECLASGGWDSKILLWDAISGELQLKINAHSGPVRDLRFENAQKNLISASLDHTVRVFGTRSLQDPSTMRIVRPSIKN